MTNAPVVAPSPVEESAGDAGDAGGEFPSDGEPSDGVDIAASCEDPENFAVVFDRHFDFIHRYLARRVGSDLADDLASETFVRAFRARASYDTAVGDARPWLYQIATNLVRSHWRTEQRRLADLAKRLVDNPMGDPEGAVESVAATTAMPALAAALADLTPEQRDPLMLYAWAELSYEQVAAALDLPIGTVRSRLSRARAILRERLSEHLDPEATTRPRGREHDDGRT